MTHHRRLPSLTQLRHLVAIADEGHFSKAAQACYVTQSSISASIKELETILGETLIERTKRSVRLTSLGLEVVARARRVLNQTSDIVDLAAASGQPLSGSMRLGIIPTISPFLLPRVLPALRRAYPSLKLQLREDQSARIVEALGRGDLDALLLAFPYPTPGMERHIFASDPFTVALPKDHPLNDKTKLTARDLKGEKILLLDEGHCLRDHILASGGISEDLVASDYQATSLHTLVQMVASGAGLTLLPQMAVDAGITRGARLTLKPLEAKSASRQIGMAWRPSSPRQQDFALLADYFEKNLA
jgi:LysR family hydrogen peroxide-inducible transcriptional activator